MNNYNSSYSSNTPEPKGCRTAIVVIFILLLVIIGTPFFLIWMIQPSQKQWVELTEISAGQPDLAISTTSSGIVLEENWLNYQIDRALTLVFQEAEIEAEFAGSNLALEKDGLSFLLGAVFENPVKGKLGPEELKAAVKAEFGIIIDKDSMMSAELKKIKIGKLSIPVSFLIKNIMKIQSVQSSLSPENLSIQGIKNLNMKDQSVQIDLNEISNEIIDGLVVQYARILPGRISISITLPAEFQEEIRSLAELFYETSPILREDLEERIPHESIMKIESAEKILASMAKEKGENSNSVLTSLLEGRVSSQKTENMKQKPLDFGMKISEGSTLISAKDSYGEFILPGESILKLMGDSEVYLKSFAEEESQNMIVLEMPSGKIRAVVSAQKENDKFTFLAGNTVIETRGTDFIIEYRKDKLELTVSKGSVNVNDNIIVGASQTLSISGQKMSTVKDVDPKDLNKLLNELSIFTSEDSAQALQQYNPLPSLINLYSVYSDMLEELSPEDRDRVMLSFEDSLNKNPEYAKKVEAFIEKAGLDKSID